MPKSGRSLKRERAFHHKCFFSFLGQERQIGREVADRAAPKLMFSLLILPTWLLTVLSVAVCSCLIKYRKKIHRQITRQWLLLSCCLSSQARCTRNWQTTPRQTRFQLIKQLQYNALKNIFTVTETHFSSKYLSDTWSRANFSTASGYTCTLLPKITKLGIIWVQHSLSQRRDAGVALPASFTIDTNLARNHHPASGCSQPFTNMPQLPILDSVFSL